MNLFKIKPSVDVLILTGIVLFALMLRVVSLETIPVGFHEDEAHIGYNAYSLLKTLHDKNGKFLPLAIDQFGDFRPAGYHYLTVIPVALFGLNEFSTRIMSALFGVFTVIAVYFLAKEIFIRRSTALIAALTITTLPWHISASRATSESIVAMCFIVLGAFLFLKSMKKRNPIGILLVISYLSFFTSFFFYHAARFFVPFLIVSLISVVFISLKSSKKIAGYLILFSLLLAAGLFLILTFSGGTNRPAQVSIFKHPETQLILDEKIREDGTQNVLITRLFHNKVTEYTYTFSQNYFKHFTGDYLFFTGGLPARYTVPFSGNLFLFQIIFLFIGSTLLFFSSVYKKMYVLGLPLLWLLFAPIPSALTWEDLPNFQRSIMMVPALVLIIAYGISQFFDYLRNTHIKFIGIIGILILYLYSTLLYAHNYFTHSLTHRPWDRGAGTKELVLSTDEYSRDHAPVVMTRDNMNRLIFYLFYLKKDPKQYQELGNIPDIHNANYGNYTFLDIPCPFARPEDSRNAVYVIKGECATPDKSDVIKNIYRTDGTVVFKIVRQK